MTTISAIPAFLEEFAPHRLAAEWDNVGLLVGDARRPVERVMTCLTVTPVSVAEAVAEKAQLIVSHHPMLFQPVRRITADDTQGNMLLDLIGAGIAVYSPHTAFDSAGSGINQRLAEGLGLADVAPLVADSVDPKLGTGRFGIPERSATLGSIAARLKGFLNAAGRAACRRFADAGAIGGGSRAAAAASCWKRRAAPGAIASSRAKRSCTHAWRLRQSGSE